MYFPRNREFGLAFSKLLNFGEGGLNTEGVRADADCLFTREVSTPFTRTPSIVTGILNTTHVVS
jgi:hypothetical protein